MQIIILPFLIENIKLLSTSQFGFRSGLLTNVAADELIDHIVRNMDSKNKCLAIFLDLSKTFDTVTTPILLNKVEVLGNEDFSTNFYKYLSFWHNKKQGLTIEVMNCLLNTVFPKEA